MSLECNCGFVMIFMTLNSQDEEEESDDEWNGDSEEEDDNKDDQVPCGENFFAAPSNYEKRCAQSKPGKWRTAVLGWLALSAVCAIHPRQPIFL